MAVSAGHVTDAPEMAQQRRLLLQFVTEQPEVQNLLSPNAVSKSL